MTKLIIQDWIPRLRHRWGKFRGAIVTLRPRRTPPVERYLARAVDFADLEHRMRTANEFERRGMW